MASFGALVRRVLLHASDELTAAAVEATAAERAAGLLARYKAGGLTNPFQGQSGMWYYVRSNRYGAHVWVSNTRRGVDELEDGWLCYEMDLRSFSDGPPSDDIVLAALIQLAANEREFVRSGFFNPVRYCRCYARTGDPSAHRYYPWAYFRCRGWIDG